VRQLLKQVAAGPWTFGGWMSTGEEGLWCPVLWGAHGQPWRGVTASVGIFLT